MSGQDQWLLKVSDDTRFNRLTSLPSDRVVVGSADDVDLRVQALGVSRHHAVIDTSDAVPLVSDLNSLNGTWVNGFKIDGPMALHHDDLIGLGNATLRVALMHDDTETRPHPVTGAEGGHRPHHGSTAATGPTQYGEGQQNAAYQGDVNAPVTGDVHVKRGRYVADRQSFQRNSIDFEYPEAVAFRSKGFARTITVLGLLVAVLGFFLFITGGAVEGGFLLFFAGGLLYALGVGIANVQDSRRKEAERRKSGNLDEEW